MMPKKHNGDELIKASTCCICLDLICSSPAEILLPHDCGHTFCLIDNSTSTMFRSGSHRSERAKHLQRRKSYACSECRQQSPTTENKQTTETLLATSPKPTITNGEVVFTLTSPKPDASRRVSSDATICDKLRCDIRTLLEKRQQVVHQQLPHLLNTVSSNVERHLEHVSNQIKLSNLELEEAFKEVLQQREERTLRQAREVGEMQLNKFRKALEKASHLQSPQDDDFASLRSASALFGLYDKISSENEKLLRAVDEIQKEGVSGRMLLYQDNSATIDALEEALSTSTSSIVKWTGQLTYDETIAVLHSAAHGGDLATVREMCEIQMPQGVQKKDLIDHKDYDNYERTPLGQAAMEGHVEVVNYLATKHHANLWARDNKLGSLPIHLAAQSGHLSVVKLLLEQCPELIEAKDSLNSTPLFRASQMGHVTVCKYLIDARKANIEARGYAGRTPLLVAAGEGHLNVVEFLVIRGADLTVRDEENRASALRLALHFKHVDVVDFLRNIARSRNIILSAD